MVYHMVRLLLGGIFVAVPSYDKQYLACWRLRPRLLAGGEGCATYRNQLKNVPNGGVKCQCSVLLLACSPKFRKDLPKLSGAAFVWHLRLLERVVYYRQEKDGEGTGPNPPNGRGFSAVVVDAG